MRTMTRMMVAALMGGMAGCTVVPLPPPPAPLLVAYPGPGKAPVLFQQDDAFCKTVVATPPVQPQTGEPQQRQPPADASMTMLTPGQAYLRCMAARGNTIQPLPQVAPPVYAYYAPYPIYSGYGNYYPWLYGDYFGFGFGYGGGYRYGFHDDFFRGGYRGGYGGYGGGFHGGGGFRR